VNDRSNENIVTTQLNGKIADYEVLVNKHYRYVFSMCLGMLANLHDAEDIAQDAMLTGLQKIKSLDDKSQFSSWILRIAKNLCIDFIRRQKRTKHLVAEDIEQNEQTINKVHDLEQAISRLPMELRVPLVMYYFDNRNAKAIAEKLGISHSGVCQKIRMARKQLHELLAERK
jgi:RNA polymerase sigma-70 factor (ECF subfamily)